MKTDVLFWVSVILCGISFLFFAANSVMLIRAKKQFRPDAAQAMEQQSFDPVKALQAVENLANAFAKAGPIATSATLCALFAIIALITSGAVTIAK